MNDPVRAWNTRIVRAIDQGASGETFFGLDRINGGDYLTSPHFCSLCTPRVKEVFFGRGSSSIDHWKSSPLFPSSTKEFLLRGEMI